jgi:hypothetical protein
MDVSPVLDFDRASRAIDRFHRGGRFEAYVAWKTPKGVGEDVCHSLKAREVSRAAVDRSPVEQLIEHRLFHRAFDDRALERR